MLSKIDPSPRSGVAMMLVLVLSVVILAVGMSMIGLTGTVMQGSVDAKTKIKSRYAAESSISVAIADAVFQAGERFGGGITTSSRSFSSGNDAGTANVSSGNSLNQEVILQKLSPMNGMRGFKIPLNIQSLGKSGAAKSKIVASVALYQVPIYQFGVFYEGPLEITPGPDMTVSGRVHTNSDAYFRGVATLSFQGPVTVVGNIFQWQRTGGKILYQLKPDTAGTFAPSLSTDLSQMTSATNSQPQAISGVRNVRFQQTRLTLAIGVGTPHSILGVCDASDPSSLKRQKFDCMVQDATKATKANARFVYTGTAPTQSWISSTPKVFYDRRELKWIKLWDFDVSAIPASVKDSIFYLDDLSIETEHVPSSSIKVIPAFRIVNASKLPRNMTIACGKPLYVLGDFNTKDASGNVSTTDYKNAQIAADAVTVLSSQWSNWKAVKQSGTWPTGITSANSSMEQKFSNQNWVHDTVCNQCASALTNSRGAPSAQSSTGNLGSTSFPVPNQQVNAAIITGNKPSTSTCLSTATNETAFEACYEGGWHNTLRFLENWTNGTVTFKGSFVCMWTAATTGLRQDIAPAVIKSGYYSPPSRIWGYDTRFDNLNNMPPGTPFLATAIVTNWLERN
jgi:hypothetical protein